MGSVVDLNKWKNEVDSDRVMFGSILLVRPFQGRKLEIPLTRTRFIIKSGLENKFCYKTSTIELFSKYSFQYELEFLGADTERSKLLLTHHSGEPFKVNGVISERVYLQRKDRLQIGFHYCSFISLNEQEDNALLDERYKHLDLSDLSLTCKLPIYIEGETGTGKTFLAQNIHDKSGLSGRYIHLNLSALNSNLFESELFGHVKGAFTGAAIDKKGAVLEATNGTLFLDEINSLSLELQTKLLLVLDNGKVRPVGSQVEHQSNFRLITSSNECLKKMVNEGRMRKDFYFRITCGFKINLPSLNSNEKNFQRVLNYLEREMDVFIPNSLKQFYLSRKWEGNVRELKQHLLKKKVLQGRKFTFDKEDEELIGINDKQVKMHEQIKTLEEIKKEYTLYAFERSGRNVSLTSKILQVAPGTVRSMITLRS